MPLGSLLGFGCNRFSKLYSPSKRNRRLVAIDEAVVKINGYRCHLWAAIDVDSREVLAVYVSRGRSMLNALIFLKRVLKACDNKPVIVVDRGPWYQYALKRLGIEYFHETFGQRNKIERFFREIKERTRRFYNNINTKTVKSIEEIATAIALTHNTLTQSRSQGGVILT
ncbi:MAG: hypothetical protein B9J98_07750 [Candidatus Terraquivivens tikiterensis]|uniref:DDE domain-containing protein n=1 Tax=Candidatus Terraquivivens tikiterensis TaxID=1980982 RepID=A0A2R7Y2T4_9ARCH|nr:MAG: hypothetical protein B9J98_07750 [Candidatus Terraquivivens tikiterensis]